MAATSIMSDPPEKGASSLHQMSLRQAISEFKKLPKAKAMNMFRKLEGPAQGMFFDYFFSSQRQLEEENAKIKQSIPKADYELCMHPWQETADWQKEQMERRDEGPSDGGVWLKYVDRFEALFQRWSLMHYVAFENLPPEHFTDRHITWQMEALPWEPEATNNALQYKISNSCGCGLNSIYWIPFYHQCASDAPKKVYIWNVISGALLLKRLLFIFETVLRIDRSHSVFTLPLEGPDLYGEWRMALEYSDGSVFTFRDNQGYGPSLWFRGTVEAKDNLQLMLNYVLLMQDADNWEEAGYFGSKHEEVLAKLEAMV